MHACMHTYTYYTRIPANDIHMYLRAHKNCIYGRKVHGILIICIRNLKMRIQSVRCGCQSGLNRHRFVCVCVCACVCAFTFSHLDIHTYLIDMWSTCTQMRRIYSYIYTFIISPHACTHQIRIIYMHVSGVSLRHTSI